ncbi:ABC transporter permease [Bacteroidaceae bacterium 14-104]|uniref:ABC transporter permease n=1 Tax=Phocaeicola oris TaxID=2896850 RepID=UPI00234F509F|nr:ABC transporter permease [Phocaeicola oris]MCE2617036.1 ABC transporter permease [Phocaeicola oris]
MKKLKKIIQEGFYDTFYIFWKELRNIFKDQGVLIFCILVPLGYPLLYSFIYTNEVLEEVPTAVVDNSRSSMSREFLRKLDATPDVNIVSYCSDMVEAQKLMKESKIYGIVYVPDDFTDKIVKGEQSRITVDVNMAGMLYYKALLTATTNVSLDMNKNIKMERYGKTTKEESEIAATPLEYEAVSFFNPQNGFASFLIPAVLMLIIQQTLLLGIGLSAGTARENNHFRDLIPMSRQYHGTFRIVLGKSTAYLMIYMAIASYMLCLVPKFFHLVQISQPTTLALFTLPYLLACIFFAMTCSIFIHHREACFVIFVCTSVPLLFISGISWPTAAIPEFWKVISWIFPSTFGINGFVKINDMGATLYEVLTEYHALWLQTGFYFITTCLVYRWQIMTSIKHVHEKYTEMKAKRAKVKFIKTND